jgi:hypothetical protein
MMKYSYLNITAAIDPNDRMHFTIRGSDDLLEECQAWIVDHCTEYTLLPKQGYNDTTLYIESVEEEEAFCTQYIDCIKAYDDSFWYCGGEHDGKESIVRRDDLKDLIDRSSIGEDYLNRIGSTARRLLSEHSDTTKKTITGLEKFLMNSPIDSEIWWFSNIGGLAGSAGYCSIKGKLVYDIYGVFRS